MLSCKPTFSLSSFTFIKRLFSSLHSVIRVVSSAYLRCRVITYNHSIATHIIANANTQIAAAKTYAEYYRTSSDKGAVGIKELVIKDEQ